MSVHLNTFEPVILYHVQFNKPYDAQQALVNGLGAYFVQVNEEFANQERTKFCFL